MLISESSVLCFPFCSVERMRRKKREWEAEMKSNIATGSLPPLQVCLSIAGKGGSAPRPARVRHHGLEKHPEPRSVNSTSGAQSSEREINTGEKETDARSPNLALSLQARWPPTHKWSYTLTHIQIHTYIQICYLLHNLTHTLMTTTHLHMHVFVSLVFLEAMLFWRNLYNPNRAQ